MIYDMINKYCDNDDNDDDNGDGDNNDDRMVVMF
jgi:hypothetical protein